MNIEVLLQEHIDECNEVLQRNNELEINELCIRLGTLYQYEVYQINNLSSCRNFTSNELRIIRDALKLYKANQYNKLEIEKLKYLNKANKKDDIGRTININCESNINSRSNLINNNILDIINLFKNVRNDIENNALLQEDEVNEIIEKINEIENISKEDISRDKKWNKLKSIVNWLTNKGVDIAIKIYPLIISSLQ